MDWPPHPPRRELLETVTERQAIRFVLFCWFVIGPTALLLTVALLFLISIVIHQVAAHEVGTPFSEWFMSLKQPDNPIASCCGPADQFYVERYEVDHATGGFTATVAGFDELIHVPPEKVNWHDVNPTGRGVIFMSTSWVGNERIGGKIYCFIPGIGT